MSAKKFSFLLLPIVAGGAAVIVSALRKRQHIKTEVNTDRTLKIIFTPLLDSEPNVPAIEEAVRALMTTYPYRPVFLYVVPNASAGKGACSRVFDLRNRFDTLFHCESRIFEAQLYYDLNPLANKTEASLQLAKDISALIEVKRDICQIVLPDGTVKASDGSVLSLVSLFRGGQYLHR